MWEKFNNLIKMSLKSPLWFHDIFYNKNIKFIEFFSKAINGLEVSEIREANKNNRELFHGTHGVLLKRTEKPRLLSFEAEDISTAQLQEN